MIFSRRFVLLSGSALLAGCSGARLTNSAGSSSGRSVLVDTAKIPVPAPRPDLATTERERVVKDQASLGTSEIDGIRQFDSNACLQWNQVARELVAQYRMAPPRAARAYALLSIAQYDSLLTVRRHQAAHPKSAPFMDDTRVKLLVSAPVPGTAYPDAHAAIAHASAEILRTLFPASAAQIDARRDQHTRSRMLGGVCLASDGDAGIAIGRAVAAEVLGYASTDGSNTPWDGVLRKDPDAWYPDNGTPNPPPPVLPTWGQSRTWLVSDRSAIAPPPPLARDSAQYAADVAEVRRVSDSRTSEQLVIAQRWAGGGGTATPPGIWNEIAVDMAQVRNMDELATARMLCLLNRALYDASVICWDVKYRYWTRRPSQVDPGITLPIGLPNFPSYSSGHSSFSGAAETILGYFFPEESGRLNQMAEEASVSRIYGGIHFRHDCVEGLVSGRKIGAIAVQWARADGLG